MKAQRSDDYVDGLQAAYRAVYLVQSRLKIKNAEYYILTSALKAIDNEIDQAVAEKSQALIYIGA